MTDDHSLTGRMPKRRTFLKTAGAAGVTGLAGCLGGVTGGGDSGPIQIGGVLPLTGGLADPAKWIKRAWQNVWAEEINNSDDKLLGREVEVTVYDTELNKSKMRTLTNRLLTQDNVDLFFGPYPTLTMPVISPILEKNDMTVLHLFWPRSHILDKQDNPDKWEKQFGFGAGTYGYIHTLLDFLNGLPSGQKPSTIAFAGRNDLYGKDGIKTFRNYISENDLPFEIVLEEFYDPSSTSLTNVARKMKTKDPDVTVGQSYMGDGILLMKGLAEVDVNSDWMWINVGPQIPAFVDALGAPSEGVLGSSPYSYNVPTKANERLFQVAQDNNWDTPNYSYGFGYMQAQIYTRAIREAGSIDQDDIHDQFESLTFDVVTGKMSFDPKINFSFDKPMFETQIQNGEIEVVYQRGSASKTTAEPKPTPESWPNV